MEWNLEFVGFHSRFCIHMREICSREFRVTNVSEYFAFTEASMSISFEEFLANHRLSKGDLSHVCSKEHRDELTKRINDWKAVGAALRFTQKELDMIDSGYENDDQKKTTLLIQWCMRVGKEATYLNLAKLLFTGGMLDLLHQLCVLLKAPGTTPTTPAGQHPIITRG